MPEDDGQNVEELKAGRQQDPHPAVEFHCPNTGAIVDLGVEGDALDEAQGATLVLKRCPACQLEHVVTKEDLFLATEASA